MQPLDRHHVVIVDNRGGRVRQREQTFRAFAAFFGQIIGMQAIVCHRIVRGFLVEYTVADVRMPEPFRAGDTRDMPVPQIMQISYDLTGAVGIITADGGQRAGNRGVGEDECGNLRMLLVQFDAGIADFHVEDEHRIDASCGNPITMDPKRFSLVAGEAQQQRIVFFFEFDADAGEQFHEVGLGAK